uniref:Uncharacterized protein n=1 Tax=Tanacetum cinerariifolium TaxID=118510 RepID=A0A699HNN3_TANCI|nr:hypothetical protein [Tanacetum cinerariifolium]
MDQYIFQMKTPATQEESTGHSAQPQDDTSANVVYDISSPVDSTSKADTEILNVEEEHGKEVSHTVALEERTIELDKGRAILDLVHENLKLTTKEQVHMENLPSSSGTLSSMKNLDDAFTFGDQFLNDKSSEGEPGKANMETKVESMVTVPIHQTSSSAHPLSTIHSYHRSYTSQTIITSYLRTNLYSKTKTTTTLLPPPPP